MAQIQTYPLYPITVPENKSIKFRLRFRKINAQPKTNQKGEQEDHALLPAHLEQNTLLSKYSII